VTAARDWPGVPPAPVMPRPRSRRRHETPFQRRERELVTQKPKPLTTREIVDQVRACADLPIAVSVALDSLIGRVEELEMVAHVPYDFSHLVQRLEVLEAKSGAR
jgi:hypothetical protein